MLILSVDTSAIASAALLTGEGQILRAFATEDTRTHAEVLAPGIRALLDEAAVAPAELDSLVVGVGPGPFTGLRSGIATARALAFAWDKPLHGVMSLDAVAAQAAPAARAAGQPEYIVATDARRKEVYWARYGTAGSAVMGTAGDAVLPELLDGPHVGPASEVPPLPAYGRGAGLYPEQLAAVAGFEGVQPTAEALGRTAAARLARGLPLLDTTPLYLRESDAKVPGPRKRAL
ncbi:tRNA (adenosine(37)-N6)-threonylcarbamoyltransferase complex dimerization subunit type 1 TsaB [Arthrobacter mobilis]|uniref:tRNA (Adenosine(37)-N6)-threonylcarbamoyltransferase complex dimerization subunit type 1 TsaB n=1 Tax=Arthrobacter mobilis TaxID=2724944 RepID=A0A7X6K502_9MICC|nr:tRNA (adenosine(37)-N6)-threonylcarbamoyltransferase complex dimerization subunit type 1 TsaB [Arthrobacter mobilis]NKX53664.1 tRNA (adenosine(37)-N6)-threonylcarbamoyltransferase complex dimerization subunit type 1 TsaB [Arthrobacter mobilis]